MPLGQSAHSEISGKVLRPKQQSRMVSTPMTFLTRRRQYRFFIASIGMFVFLGGSPTQRAMGQTTGTDQATVTRLEAATARLEAAAGRLEAAENAVGTSVEKAPPFPPATPWAVVNVSRDVGLSVVRIDVAQEVFVAGKRTLRRGIGSGVIFDPRGYVLTNFHVAGRAADLYVTLATKERIPAKLIGDDHWTDLAVIQMDMNEVKKKGITFRCAKLGSSKQLLTGQDVMAIGTPFGLNRTTTLGQISNNERTFYPEEMTIDLTPEENLETGEFSNWIQMDTPINPGNSGGPLVDLDGNVVGINTRGGGQNLNFAIPIDTAKPVIAAILASAGPNKKGKVERSDLGIDLKPLQDLETFYDIDINHGVLVNSVDQNGAASKAGLRSQDILLSVNGTPTNCRFPEEIAAVRKMIADLPIGSDVDLEIKRGKKTIKLAAKTLRLESVFGEEKELKVWGMSVREVTRAYANDNQLDDDSGVAIETLEGGHPGSDAELSRDDVIRAVDGHPVTDIDEFMRLYKDSVANKETDIRLDILRDRADITKGLKVTYDASAEKDEKAEKAEKPSTQNKN
jgi:serine protease Do